MTNLDFRNTNALWGSVLVETLHRLGLRQAVVSPGSRSTPLTVALARHPGIEAVPVLDERSASFFALGLARQHHRPVLLVCTSGTAGANYFPAVIEAQESGVPLLVITADRPPELRDCRSGQTIDQQKLFGSHVNFHHELAVPAASLPLLRYLRQTVAHAWERTRWPAAGPVHLNAPFRDPLAPVADRTAAPLRAAWRDDRFFAGVRESAAGASVPTEPAPGLAGFFSVGRGLIVAGPSQPADLDAYVAAVGRLSAALGWPVLADALSPLRNRQSELPALVTAYDLIARSSRLTRRLRPDAVLCLDGWPTSKALRDWLGAAQPEVFVVSSQPLNADALHLRTRHLRQSVESLAAPARSPARNDAWLQAWAASGAALVEACERELAQQAGRFEGRACQLLPRHLPRGTPVFLANSMPVRDAEYFWPGNDRGHAIFFNRGANGIDGTLSTALGIAHGSRPAVLVTGDLALLHDTNGWLLRKKFRGSLTIVLINNEGGGIFGHLPVARFDPPFEEYFATPQTVDFRRLAGAYGAGHVRVRDWAHFSRLVSRLPARGVRLLELRTDRKRDAAFRQELFASLSRQAR